MSEQSHGPEDMPTAERMKTLGGAMVDAVSHQLTGEHETDYGARYTANRSDVERVIGQWPAASKRGARQILAAYGPPNEATPTKLFWYRNGPWKRTVVTSDVVTHNFPAPHSDFLMQFVDYRVPIEKFDEIARFDGSCIVDRTAGEVAARCDSEAANLITLNLMHDIVTGETSVEKARESFGEAMMAYAMGRDAPYAERLQFAVAEGGTEDQDSPVIAEAMIKQMAGKVKDIVTRD